jgi:hypothetical protein
MVQVFRCCPSSHWKRIRQSPPKEMPATIPNGGESRCQPMPAPSAYSVTSDSDKTLVGIPATAAARALSGSRDSGKSDAGVIAAEPAR